MKTITPKLVFLPMLLLSITAFAGIALADYVPPSQQERAGDYSKSTGVRGGGNQPLLILLAPQTYVGQTFSNMPSFVWIVKAQSSSYETDFRLFEFDEKGNIHARGNPLRFQSEEGINQLSFPPHQLPLTLSKKYLWQVAIRQNNGDWLIQKAEFRQVEMPLKVAQTLTLLSQETDRAELYAENGFWYDALASSLGLAHQGELGPQASHFLQSLAESDNLSLSEEIEASMMPKRMDDLMHIAEYYLEKKDN